MASAVDNRLVRPRILVVEDDLLIAMDLEDILDRFGCEVVGPFGQLNQAMSAAEGDLDGAVVDLNLREESSFPLIERLKDRSVAVIVCSGYADIPNLREKLGDTPTLPKPCSPRTLAGLMREHFGWREAGVSRPPQTRSGTPPQ